MDWSACWFARPIGLVPEDVSDILKRRGEHELLAKLCVYPIRQQFSEAFTTKVARDQALGPCGQVAQFVPSDWYDHEQAGFDFKDIAVGHAFGEPGFERLANALVNAHARVIMGSRHPRELVLARHRYFVSGARHGRIFVGAMPEFSVTRDDREIAATMRWLQDAFAAHLAEFRPVGR